MPGRLEGKVAIVTGAGSVDPDGIGNGRAAAILFAREGARVLLVDRRRELAERTRELIGEDGVAVAFETNITTREGCEAMVAEAVSRWGKLDILDNNVGIGVNGTVVDVSEDSWDLQLRVNVTSMMLASKAAIPAMRENGGGAIVNISSIASHRPRGLTPYATSKGAVEALTRGMAADHGREGIRVNCIAPGPVYTPMVYTPGMSDERREARRRSSALGIEGSGWDVGYAALFLVSDEARYITGVTLPVDGGVLVN
jgi:NAD(P)-dependent dehydrogenase (short-subunit alcohol dehydrogenase family)